MYKVNQLSVTGGRQAFAASAPLVSNGSCTCSCIRLAATSVHGWCVGLTTSGHGRRRLSCDRACLSNWDRRHNGCSCSCHCKGGRLRSLRSSLLAREGLRALLLHGC